MKPIVGITGRRVPARHGHVLHGVYYTYVQWLQPVARTVLLPIVPDQDPHDILSVVRGLVLPGGEDISDAGVDCRESDPERDVFEKRLVRAAIEQGVPLLGICRGMQLIASLLGGTLIPIPPSCRDTHANNEHSVHVIGEGDEFHTAQCSIANMVFSNHRLAVSDVGPHLTAVAHSPDGVCEGLRGQRGYHVYGVQWHPEVSDGPISQWVLRRFSGLLERTTNAS